MAAFRIHEIRELIRLIDESDIEEFEIDNEGAKLVIRKSNRSKYPTPTLDSNNSVWDEYSQHLEEIRSPVINIASDSVPANSPPSSVESQGAQGLHHITSPMVGTFYRASSPDAEPYVKVGDNITDKSVVCIVEAMKLMNEIEAEVSGQVVEILVENGQIVDYGQPLFLIKT